MPKRPKPFALPWVKKRPKEYKTGSWSKTDNSKLYQSRKWRRFRKWFFQHYPLCAECLRNGVVKEGRDVDHIQPIRLGGEIYDLDNLQTLCKSGHNRKSGREAHIKTEDDGS